MFEAQSQWLLENKRFTETHPYLDRIIRVFHWLTDVVILGCSHTNYILQGGGGGGGEVTNDNSGFTTIIMI